MTPLDLAARAMAMSEKGGRDLEVRIRYTPEGRIVRGGLGQPPQQDPPTFSAGIYEVGADEHIILATKGQNPDHALATLAMMMIDRGMQWFVPSDRPQLEVVPEEAGEESAGSDDEPDVPDAPEPPDVPDAPEPPAETPEAV